MGGSYGSPIEELQSVIDDLNDTEELFIISVKMNGVTVYSYPGKREKINNQMQDLIDSIDNGIMHKIGGTWINPQFVLTARIIKYSPEVNE
jgi:hypothetical protein